MKYKKIALIFPGQGAQYIGMGQEFYEKFDFIRDIYDQGSQVLGYDVADTCFKKPKMGKMRHKPDLNKTIYTQPMVLTTAYAAYGPSQDGC